MPIAHCNGIDIWFETFGKKDDPPILLIMGGCAQGLLWPMEFCEGLAKEGFFVIRYDHRDAGESTCFDFEKNPYTHDDMTLDAIELLNYLNIKKASLVGLSMGGRLAIIMAANFSTRVNNLTLISTSLDFEPYINAIENKPLKNNSLPPPTNEYVTTMEEFLKQSCETYEEKLKQRIDIWSFLNGNAVPLDEKDNRKLQEQFLARLSYPAGLNNHILANKFSEPNLEYLGAKITQPTLIIHGTEDPIFPSDHGQALADGIANSRYVLIEGMGHVPNSQFFKQWISEIKLLNQ